MRFNLNNPVWAFLTTLVHFTLMNVVFLISLIPIITIGPALAAAYSTMFAYIDHDDINLTREYLARFKREFVQAIKTFPVFLVVGAALVFGIFFWLQITSNITYLVYPVLIIAAVVFILTFEFLYPLQARFANTTPRLWKLSLTLPWKVVGHALGLIAIDAVMLILLYGNSIVRIFLLLFGTMWVIYAKSLVLNNAFNRVQNPGHVSEPPNNPQATY